MRYKNGIKVGLGCFAGFILNFFFYGINWILYTIISFFFFWGFYGFLDKLFKFDFKFWIFHLFWIRYRRYAIKLLYQYIMEHEQKGLVTYRTIRT